MRCRYENATRVGVLTTIVLLTGIANPAASQAGRRFALEDEKHEGFTMSGHFLPHWSGGAILTVQDNPSDAPLIVRIGKNGERERIEFTIPGRHHITITGLAGAADGTLAVIGSVYSDDGRATTFLARIQRDRAHQMATQLWPYVPSVVTFAPDGKLWIIGRVRDGDWVSEYNVLKLFDKSGRLLSTMKLDVKPYIHSGDDPAKPRIRDAAQLSALRASMDRVGWLTRGNEYIEFSTEGGELSRYDGPEHACPDQASPYLALSVDNEVIVGPTKCEKPGYWRLNRGTRKWEPVEVSQRQGSDRDIVLGFDGDTLVASSSHGAVRRYKAVLAK